MLSISVETSFVLLDIRDGWSLDSNICTTLCCRSGCIVFVFRGPWIGVSGCVCA